MKADTRTLDRLLGWLCLYVVILCGLAALSGKLAEAIPVITNLVSGFAGAAFAIMRLGHDSPPNKENDERGQNPDR